MKHFKFIYDLNRSIYHVDKTLVRIRGDFEKVGRTIPIRFGSIPTLLIFSYSKIVMI